jgi:hypothetical protein
VPEPTRAKQSFPSRQYSHGSSRPAGFAAPAALAAGRTYRFVLGRDAAPSPIDATTPGAPRDPLAVLVLFAGGPLPLTLRALLAHLDSGANPLPVQRSFIIADGGQIPWSPATDTLQRNFRLVITRHVAEGRNPDLFVSTSTSLDSESAFLQVIGWDETVGAFQFYDRREGSWFWAGSSWDALAPGSRGHGPFDSHVNGALNMKELKRPWVHWHSQAAQIPDSALAPNDPFAAEPLWTKKSQGDELERAIARPGIQRWTTERMARRTQGGVLTALPEFMRQVLTTTTINLAASPTSFPALAAATKIQLPLTFFVNSDALIDVLDLDPGIGIPSIAAAVYRDTLARFKVAITDGQFRFDRDTHFLFVVPEPAYEDVLILQRLVEIGVLSRKLAACLLMVDFANPVFSRRRAGLMRHVPGEARVGAAAAFDEIFITAVRAAVDARTAGPAEAELLANWETPDPWPAAFEARLRAFMDAVMATIGTADGFARCFELAESRRREFRKRPLAEFRLTIPVTNIPDDAPLLEFAEDGSIRQKISEGDAP